MSKSKKRLSSIYDEHKHMEALNNKHIHKWLDTPGREIITKVIFQTF